MCIKNVGLRCELTSRRDLLASPIPALRRSLFVASVLGTLIPAGVAFLSSPNTPAPARDLTAGVAPPRGMIVTHQNSRVRQNMGLQSAAVQRPAGFPR